MLIVDQIVNSHHQSPP